MDVKLMMMMYRSKFRIFFLVFMCAKSSIRSCTFIFFASTASIFKMANPLSRSMLAHAVPHIIFKFDF